MNIAICDDCARDIKSLEERILKVVDPETIKKFYEFHSGKDLLDHYTKFDIIFLDPPYQSGLAEDVCSKIVEYELLKEQGYIIWERSAQIQRKEICGLNMVKEKSYKTTVMTFLALEESEI